jgi:hypothetical protein
MKKKPKTNPYFEYKDIKVKIVNDSVLYVELDGYVYYIDNSTNEQIFKKWKDNRVKFV